MKNTALIQEDLKTLKSLVKGYAANLGVSPEEHPFLHKAVDVLPDIVIDFVLQGKIKGLQQKTNEIIKALDRMSDSFDELVDGGNHAGKIIDALNAISFDTQTCVKTIEGYSKTVVGFSEQEVIERHQISDKELDAIEAFYKDVGDIQRDIDMNQVSYRQVELLVNAISTFREYLSSLKKRVDKIVAVHDNRKVLSSDQAVTLGSACAMISRVSDVLVGEMRSAVKVKIVVVPVEAELEKL